MLETTQLEKKITTALTSFDLFKYVTNGPVTIDQFGDVAVVELVLSEASKVDAVQRALQPAVAGVDLDLRVRGVWKVQSVGDAQPAYGSSGGLRAAVLIPVTVVSGSRTVQATVSITKLAEIGLRDILGPLTNLQQVARMVIENALKWGGSSSWNPEERDYFEVASNSVATLSRELRNVA